MMYSTRNLIELSYCIEHEYLDVDSVVLAGMTYSLIACEYCK